MLSSVGYNVGRQLMFYPEVRWRGLEGRTRTHRENVEPRAEVYHDGGIPVPCRLFLGKLDHRDALSVGRK